MWEWRRDERSEREGGGKEALSDSDRVKDLSQS